MTRRPVCYTAFANFDAWIRTPRVWVMVLCTIIYAVMQSVTDTGGYYAYDIELFPGVWEKLFVKWNNGFYVMGSLLFLVMVSELPRKSGYQYFLQIRSSKSRWVLGQVVYCFCMALFMVLLLSAAYLLTIGPGASWKNEFADVENILAGLYGEEDAFIPSHILRNFSPPGACFFAAVPALLFWLTQTLIILWLSLMGHPRLGPSVYGSILLAQTTLLVEMLPPGLVFPMDIASLGAIASKAEGEELKRVSMVIGAYVTVDAFLILLLWRTAVKKDLFFEEKND